METERRDEDCGKLQALNVELCLTQYAWNKLQAYCRAASPLEVSGFMLIEQDDELFLVTDCFIPKQVCTSSETEMDGNSIAELQMQLIREKKLGPKKRLGHFHTHPTFGVFWSSTDMAMRQTLRKGTDLYISLVLNNKGEALAALDVNGEVPFSVTNLPIEVLPDTSLREQCKAEVEAKVREKTYTSVRVDGQADLFGDGPLTSEQQAVRESRRRGRALLDAAAAEQDEDARKELLEHYLEEGATFSDHTGTYQNIAGEIVKVAPPEAVS